MPSEVVSPNLGSGYLLHPMSHQDRTLDYACKALCLSHNRGRGVPDCTDCTRSIPIDSQLEEEGRLRYTRMSKNEVCALRGLRDDPLSHRHNDTQTELLLSSVTSVIRSVPQQSHPLRAAPQTDTHPPVQNLQFYGLGSGIQNTRTVDHQSQFSSLASRRHTQWQRTVVL